MKNFIKTPAVTKGGSYEVTKGKVTQARQPNQTEPVKTTTEDKGAK